MSLLKIAFRWALGGLWAASALQAISPLNPAFTNTQWHYYRILSNLQPVLKNGNTALIDFPYLVRITNDVGLRSVFSNNGDDITFAGSDGTQIFH